MKERPQNATESAERALVATACEVPEIASDVYVPPEAFRHPFYRAVWVEVQRRSLAREPIDALIVASALEARGERVDLNSLVRPMEAIPESCPGYASIIIGAWHARRLRLACSDAINAVRGGTPALDVSSSLMGELNALDGGPGAKTLAMPELVRERFRDLQGAAERKARNEETGLWLPTGIEGLDEKINGLQYGIPTIVAARPGMGKSALSLTLTVNAIRRGFGVHVFSLEDTRQAYMDRVLAQYAGIPVEAIRKLELNRGELERLQAASVELADSSKWAVDDQAGITASDVVRSVRRAAKRNDTRLVIVDYISLLRPVTKGRRRDEELTESINILGDAARTDNMSYVVVSQLNRSCESRENKRPMLSDLRESGGLEERAKCVLLLYRPGYYKETEDPTELEVIVAKNNQGRTGTVWLRWDAERVQVS